VPEDRRTGGQDDDLLDDGLGNVSGGGAPQNC
jgi:hypothetical protein